MKKDSPCRYCESRYIGCHDRCEKYQLFRSQRENEREAGRYEQQFAMDAVRQQMRNEKFVRRRGRT